MPVQIVLFDVPGRQVTVLQDDELPAGRHAFRIETGSLPAGSYLMRVVTADLSVSRPLIVVR